MANHFLYELKARLEHAVKIEEPILFKAEVESVLKDLKAEVDPYADDEHLKGEIWEEPSKSQKEEGIKAKRIFP
jgi:hypothetical protein